MMKMRTAMKMKRNSLFFALTLVTALLSACGREEQREPIPVLETVPPSTFTRSTYTGTTVEFVYASTTEAPLSGDDIRMFSDRGDGIPAETGDTAADFGINYAETGDTAADFGINYADTGISAADTGDSAYVFTDAPDRAFTERNQTDTGITADNYADSPDTAAGTEYIPRETADTK